MSQTFHRELVEIDCASCGMTFGVPEPWYRARKTNADWFKCPNGHSLIYGKSEADELREKLASEKRNTEWWRGRADRAEKRADHESAVARGYKGQLTRVKKRVGNGVCPCCKRTFADLRRHMRGQHPDFGFSADQAPSVGSASSGENVAGPSPVSEGAVEDVSTSPSAAAPRPSTSQGR